MPKQRRIYPMRKTKPTKRARRNEKSLAKRSVLVVLVLLLIVACASPTVVYECPMPCPNGDVDDEELDGKLDDAPATLAWKINVEHECGCV